MEGRKVDAEMRKIIFMTGKYINEVKIKICVYVLICLIISPVSLIIPYFTGEFIDDIYNSTSYNVLYQYSFAILGVISIKLLLKYIRNMLYTDLQMKMAYRFNSDVIRHIQDIDLLISSKMEPSYLSQQVNIDTNEIIIFVLTFLQNSIGSCLELVIPTIILIDLDRRLSIVMGIVIIIYIFYYLIFKEKIYAYNQKFKKSQSAFFTKIYEQFNSIKFIKIHSVEDFFKARLSDEFDKLYKTTIKRQNFIQVFELGNEAIYFAMKIILLFICGREIINKTLTVGQFTIFSTYFSVILSSVKYFMNFGKIMQESRVSMDRIQKLLDYPTIKNGNYKLNKIQKIQINNLFFSYGEKGVFNGQSFLFEKGKIYLIMGENGCGKTTLLNIITGLYNGKFTSNILFDGKKMDELDIKHYRKNVLGVSEQTPYLISDTILTNITLEHQEECYKKRAIFLMEYFGLNKRFENLEADKFLVEDVGNNLSGGERQKIAIIRALIKDASILILDEPSSALDVESTITLCKILNSIKKDKIIIIVTHDKNFSCISDEIISLSWENNESI